MFNKRLLKIYIALAFRAVLGHAGHYETELYQEHSQRLVWLKVHSPTIYEWLTECSHPTSLWMAAEVGRSSQLCANVHWQFLHQFTLLVPSVRLYQRI